MAKIKIMRLLTLEPTGKDFPPDTTLATSSCGWWSTTGRKR